MSVFFAKKFIEDTVRKTLNIADGNAITANDMARIKYLSVGVEDGGVFFVEMSAQNPPEPFSDTDGGDEWTCALRGRQIEAFLKQEKEGLLRPSVFKYYDRDNTNEDANSSEAVNAWKIYKASIVGGYGEDQIEGFDECVQRWNEKKSLELDEKWSKKKRRAWVRQWAMEKDQEIDKLRDKWYEDNYDLICQDIPHFTGLEVLRIKGIALPDYCILRNMKSLKTLEPVETYLSSICGYEKLSDLQQLSCWWD